MSQDIYANGERGDVPGRQPLLSTHELAAALGCSVDRVYDMARSGTIPYYVVGKRKKYDLAEVREAIRRQAVSSDSPRPLGGQRTNPVHRHLKIEAMRR